MCPQIITMCQTLQPAAEHLVVHEKAEHGDEYDSRLELYVRFFKQSTCQSDPSPLILELTFRCVLASKDFIDLLHPVPEIPPSISD
jgi:hypothetical protein